MLTVTCNGALNGQELTKIDGLKTHMKTRLFRAMLAQQLDVPKHRLRILRPDGRLVTDDDNRTALNALLGASAKSLPYSSSLEEELDAEQQQLAQGRRRE